MKKFLFFFLLLTGTMVSQAYDFSAVAPTGQTLYYNINGSAVTVTYPGFFDDDNNYWHNVGTEPSGALEIPASVTYNDTTYSVTSIGKYAFHACHDLTSVTIPNTVTSIGNEAFYGCRFTSITIPNSVTSIGDWSFTMCALTSITIGNSVTTIGEYAFWSCDDLTSVTIPNSVTSIGGSAFSYCYGLTSVTIGNSVDSIGALAFVGCSGLTSVTIPNSVTSIGDGAFENCSGLTSVTIGNSVTSIGSSAFYGCSSLTSVTIGNSVTNIGNYAFCNCNGLTSVTIGDSVTCIGESAFENCHGLTSVVIGSGVTDIHDMAFEDCDHLSDITCKAVTPPTVANHDAFEGVWKGLPLSVPNESVSQYQIAYAWREFTNIIGMNIPEDYTITVTVNNASMGSVSGAGTYADGETVTLTATANMGYRFVRWSNGMENNPYTFTATEDVDLIAYFEAIPTQGINEANVTFNINSGNGVIVLNGVEGQMMRIFDILGYVIVSERAVDNKQYQMPSSGVYFVQVDNYPAQKVVVVK